VRDLIVCNPLISGHQPCRELSEKGGNPLDWYYVAKLVRKLNRERALAVDQQKIGDPADDGQAQPVASGRAVHQKRNCSFSTNGMRAVARADI
jgi:hypothetical protein